jgi:hypothetical protein
MPALQIIVRAQTGTQFLVSVIPQQAALHQVQIGHLRHLSLRLQERRRAGLYLLLYVDIVLTASSTSLLHHIIKHLGTIFALQDLEPLHFFLGIQVQCSPSDFFLHQAKYTDDILDRARMVNCKPAPTPIDNSPKSFAIDGSPAPDDTFYHNMVGALHYITLTQPDITYAINQACLHMHAPRDTHWALIKRILRYVRGTIGHDVCIYVSAGTQIIVYSNAD